MLEKIWARTGFAVGLGALILQFSITIPASMEAGRSLFLSIVFYFSFFTILTNITLVLIYAARLFDRMAWLQPFSLPWVRGAAAAAITLVMSFYHFVLAALWQPQGLFWVADVTLHYVTPLLYLAGFAAFMRTGTLGARNIPTMLIPPIIYLAYVLVRGALVGEYPYPILDVNEHGLSGVLLNSLFLLAALAILNAIAVLIDRIGTPHKPA